MRKTFTLLIALLALTVSAWATPIQVGDFYYEIRDYGVTYAELVKVSGEYDWKSYYEVSGDITIPGTINDGVSDYPVYIIGNTAFGSCTDITSVTVEEGVNYISNFAFMGCSNLTTATLPSTITSFGNQVFGYSGLTSITIRATSPADISENNPFADASSLAHIYVPAASVDAYKTACPATTTTTITWDQADIESLGLADNDVDEFSPSQEIDGITASLTRTDAGQYSYCQIDNSNLWITMSCGYITFTSAVGDISRIVITYDENSYHSLSDLTEGWTEDNQAHTLT